MTAPRLIVGLANPGPQYAETRHNAGAWFVERLADRLGVRLGDRKPRIVLAALNERMLRLADFDPKIR